MADQTPAEAVDDAMADQTAAAAEEETTAAAEEETTPAAATDEPAMGAMEGTDGTQPLDGLPETASMPISVDDAMADQTDGILAEFASSVGVGKSVVHSVAAVAALSLVLAFSLLALQGRHRRQHTVVHDAELGLMEDCPEE